MATISSLGSGSGLDLQSLLTGLMQLEQRPLLALQSKEASYQSRISSLGSLKSALASLQTAATAMAPSTGSTAAAKYTSYTASVADTSIATATVTSGAVAGSYSLTVSSLAQSQRLASATNALYTSASSAITTGNLTIDFGSLATNGSYTADSSRSKTITIDSTNATLGGLRDAINAANVGATATIVTGTDGAHLVLTSNASGLENVMKLSGTLAGFGYDPATDSGAMSQNASIGGRAATNAAFTLNGIAATSSTNSVSGVLDGVTLNLLKTSTVLTAESGPTPATYTPTTLTVSKNTSTGLTTALSSFITAYNSANKAIADLGGYDVATKSAGALQGDSILLSAKSQMSNLLYSTTAGGTSIYQRLSDIGVAVGKKDSLGDAALYLDSAKLGAAVAANPEAVANVVAAIGSAYKTSMDSIVGTRGTISSATASATQSIKDLAKREKAVSDRLTVIQANYVKQFTTLDSLIASMKSTSSYLTTQLSSLPGFTSSSN